MPAYVCHFREGEGVGISYVKKRADLNHPNMVTPNWQQLNIGWTEDGPVDQLFGRRETGREV